MMKKIFCILPAVFILMLISGDCQAGIWKKKDRRPQAEQVSRKQPSPYEKLFQGKQKTTAAGLMKIHSLKERDKDLIYVEFPLLLLDKDMMLTSAIREISDSGEGAVGQFNNFVQMRFSRQDSSLLIRLVSGDEPFLTVGDSNMQESFRRANRSGVWQVLDILAYTPDSTAVVVDMTKLFMDHTDYTSPFAAFAGNSMGGFSERVQRLQPGKTKLRGIKASGRSVMVTGDYHYLVDHKYMGKQVFRKDVPVNVVADRILMLLPEEPMRPRYADVRVGAVMMGKKGVRAGDEGFREQAYTMRWRLEPSEPEKFGKGELVEPVKPIVFYMDTLIPANWKRAIKDAAESWNPAFEKIGFGNVVRVAEFPVNDTSFDANNIEYNVIRYATTWLSDVQNSMHADLRSGEILNASFILHNGLGLRLSEGYKTDVLGLDPAVRSNDFIPDTIFYELMKAYMTSYFGNALGLTTNDHALTIYSLDSLRSPQFTQKHGIAPSIMIPLTYNSVIRPEEAARGVRFMPKGPGEFDDFTIKWLYTPLPEARTAEEEVPLLEAMVREEEKACPYYRYGRLHRLMNDATCSARVPGDNQLRAVQQYLEYIKWFFTHLDEWYKDGDEDFAKREGFVRENALKIPMTLRWLANYIGGFSIRYTEKGNFYDFVPKARQKEVLSYCLSIVKDISWIDVPDFEKQVGLRESQSFMTSWGLFNQLVSRVDQLFFSEEKNKGGYTAQEFSEDIDREVWRPTREGRKLTPMEKNMQQAFLGCIASSAEVAGVPQRAGVPAQMSLQTPREWVLPVHYAASVYPGTMNVFPEVFPESVYMKELFVPALETLRVSRYPVEHLYFDMLLKAKELIQRASVTGHPDDRIHYRQMLMKLNHLLDKD